jgi:NADH-quinone oxidoreductase subunit N
MNMAIEIINHAAALVVPEVVLLLTVCMMFMIGPFLVSPAGHANTGVRHRWGGLALAALGTAWLIWYNSQPVATTHGGPFAADALVWFTRGLSLTAGALLTLLLWNQVDDAHAAEAHACLLSIVAGVNLVAAANDLVVLFLALELLSIPTYVILYLVRRDHGAREATIKYFLLSLFSSALVLYGMSWLYGATGTTNFYGIFEALGSPTGGGEGGIRHLALALMVAGLCFRITAVPFHFYAPDVFQGVPAANAAMLSFVPKLAGFVALLKVIPLTGSTIGLHVWLPDRGGQVLLTALAVTTMFVGNLMALRQRNLYRLMAYSSIAHAGYMLVGLAVGNVGVVGGTSAVLFYLTAYALMTIGVFALLRGAGGSHHVLQSIDDLRGLSHTHPSTAIMLTVCLLSLSGLPPTAGFIGKLNLFLAAWGETTPFGHTLAALLGLNAAIAAFYYLRLIAVMYLDTAPESTRPQPVELVSWLGGLACTIATLVLFASPQWLWDVVQRATG